MGAYVLVLIVGMSVSQQEYANMASCTNAGAIVSKMANMQWACIPKNNRTTK